MRSTRIIAAFFAIILALPATAQVHNAGQGHRVKNVTVVNRPNAPVPVAVRSSQLTHVGRAPSEHVTLAFGVSIGPPSVFGFLRRLPDGSIDAPATDPNFGYIIPDGKALVVTDISFNLRGSNIPPSGESSKVSLGILNSIGGGFSQSLIYQVGPVVDDSGRISGSFQIGSGIVISSGSFLAVTFSVGTLADAQFFAYGYLIDDG